MTCFPGNADRHKYYNLASKISIAILKPIKTGLERLKDKSIRNSIKGNIGYLCHAASVDINLNHGIPIVKELFGNRLKKIFSPQHGLFGDLQDNMIESDHFFHPHYQLPVYSLYSYTRKPTSDMLDGLDHMIIDLQDVGTRVYTYIWSMILTMESAGEKGVEVIVLDRPNPIGGIHVEGNMLKPKFSSFVGLYPLPMRHGLTIGEIAKMAVSKWEVRCELRIVEMEGWERKMYFDDTGLPWVMPSPNLATPEATLVYPGSVIFEGTNMSEGRGTTRSLEIIGHSKLDPFSFLEHLTSVFKKYHLEGFVLRPLIFKPTFQKYREINCGGFQIHVTDRLVFEPWIVSVILCRELYHHLGDHFIWKQPPYEYEFNNMPFDILNGTDEIRKWVEKGGGIDELRIIARNDGLPHDWLLY